MCRLGLSQIVSGIAELYRIVEQYGSVEIILSKEEKLNGVSFCRHTYIHLISPSKFARAISPISIATATFPVARISRLSDNSNISLISMLLR